MIPPLKSSDYLLNNIDLSIAGLKYGLKGKIFVNGKLYDSYMAYQGLDNDEIADIMNYILHLMHCMLCNICLINFRTLNY